LASDEPSGRPAESAAEGRGATRSPAGNGPDRARKRRFFLILLGVVVLVVAGAWLWWLHARNYESTDDAFIDARIVHVSPQVAGRVQQVLVTDNVRVQAGQVLVTLDPSDIRARYDQAKAQEQQAEAQLQQALTQVRVSEASLARARADTAGATAQASNAASELQRYRRLQAAYPAAVSSQELDRARATAANLAAQREASAQQVQSARDQIATANAQVDTARSQLATAQAQLEQAQLNLDYTQVKARIDGTVAQETVAVGDYVQPGQQLLAIVPHQVWVTANFKETQLAFMRPGQKVDLKIYAYPGVHFFGHVDSIQRGAGQAFSLLPTQNATGNFVKVVQRVPVKILIDGPNDSRYVLGPGMSVYATVHVR
jgi:membrane fusion protein (multidrug efflux system)